MKHGITVPEERIFQVGWVIYSSVNHQNKEFAVNLSKNLQNSFKVKETKRILSQQF